MKQPPGIDALKHITPLSVVRMAWKQRLLIVVITVLLTCLGVYAIHQLPNVYRAQALILVDSQRIPEKFVASTVQISLQDSLSAIGQQVLSQNRLQSIITDFHLYPELRKTKSPEELIDRMKSDLTVNLERGLTGVRSGAFTIDYEGPDPKIVAAVVNRITQLFIQENLRSREKRAQGTSEFLDEQLKEAKRRLETQEASLSRYKQEHAGELPEQQAALMGTLTRLQAELDGNQSALNRAEQNELLLENTLGFAETAVANSSAALSQATASAVAASVSPGAPAAAQPKSSDALRAQLDALRLRYYDNHPAVKHIRTELEQMVEEEQREAAQKAAAEKSGKSATEANGSALKLEPSLAAQGARAAYNRESERAATTKTQLDLLKKEIEDRNRDRRRILDEINQYEARLEKLPVREQQMTDLTRDYQTSKVNYQTLLDKEMSAEMAADMERSQQSERFTVANEARVPGKPAKPRRTLFSGIAGLGSLAFAIAIGLLMELRKNQFLGEWELPSNVRVLGRIPEIAQHGVASA